MPAPEIVFDHVYKKFSKGQRFDSLREQIPAMVRRWLTRDSREDLEGQEFWSVRDVSFHVKAGQVLGIIGHNGAGKSTILKLLTRILKPTRGLVRIEGRIGALIEVAAGFHPDLTGRENVFLQGTIMGMRRRDIAARFDEIVEFSGISDFIDTPVKRYSSGMNARLGFSIAAHLDPDVLIIDEVLAVGDAAFQRRAFERLAELATEHRPVIVVSHQLDRILSLCTDAILMEHGVAVVSGTPEACVEAYTAGLGLATPDGSAGAPIEFFSSELSSAEIPPGGHVQVRVRCRLAGAPDTLTLGVSVRSSSADRVLFATSTSRLGGALPTAGELGVEFDLAGNLGPGVYYVDAYGYDSLTRVTYPGLRRVLHVTRSDLFTGSAYLEPRVVVDAGAAGRSSSGLSRTPR